jgi:hypothetical protein
MRQASERTTMHDRNILSAPLLLPTLSPQGSQCQPNTRQPSAPLDAGEIVHSSRVVTTRNSLALNGVRTIARRVTCHPSEPNFSPALTARASVLPTPVGFVADCSNAMHFTPPMNAGWNAFVSAPLASGAVGSQSAKSRDGGRLGSPTAFPAVQGLCISTPQKTAVIVDKGASRAALDNTYPLRLRLVSTAEPLGTHAF